MMQVLANLLYQKLCREPESKIRTISLFKGVFPENEI